MMNKFLNTYSFFYYMKIPHGNLISSNIGVTFDNNIKLMDFQLYPQQSNIIEFEKDLITFK